MTNISDQVVLYTTQDGSIALDVTLKGETVWLTQKQMSILFDTERSVVTKHLRNIFNTGELDEISNVQKMHIANSDKRIDATLFLWFLQKNAALYQPDGTKRIADNALVAMTLLIAESRPEEKDLLTRVLVHLIHSKEL